MPKPEPTVTTSREVITGILFDYDRGEILIKVANLPDPLILGAHLELSKFTSYINLGRRPLKLMIHHGIIVEAGLT